MMWRHKNQLFSHRRRANRYRNGVGSEDTDGTRKSGKGITKRGETYTNILIATDGSELAGNAVQHGIALAMRIGAKVTALMVLTPFHVFATDTQMIEDTPAQYEARMQRYAEKILGSVAHLAKSAGVACETIHFGQSIRTKRSSRPQRRDAVIS
jgi:hypothetical protein